MELPLRYIKNRPLIWPTLQLLGNTVPLGKNTCHIFVLLSTHNECEMMYKMIPGTQVLSGKIPIEKYQINIKPFGYFSMT